MACLRQTSVPDLLAKARPFQTYAFGNLDPARGSRDGVATGSVP